MEMEIRKKEVWGWGGDMGNTPRVSKTGRSNTFEESVKFMSPFLPLEEENPTSLT